MLSFTHASPITHTSLTPAEFVVIKEEESNPHTHRPVTLVLPPVTLEPSSDSVASSSTEAMADAAMCERGVRVCVCE